MTYSPEKHHRRSIRLPGYDYSRNGAYFITICTQSRECRFGEIVNEVMQLNDAGRIVADAWAWLGQQYDHVVMDEWVVMPNHLHGIIVIVDDCRGGSETKCTGGSETKCTGGSRTAPTEPRKPLGRLIGAYKTVSTKRINEKHQTPGEQLWQRNYHERIIRNANELHRIRQYIIDNPAQWDRDSDNPHTLHKPAKIRNFEELGV